MNAKHDSEGRIHYRSRGGRVALGVWSLFILAFAIFAAWGAVVGGEMNWLFVASAAALLTFRLYSMSLEVILAPNGELTFQGLLRRRSWPVTDLRRVRPETFCIVFTFERGGAMVASSNDDDWLDLCRRIKTLNPRATLNMPGMFRPPFERSTDTDD